MRYVIDSLWAIPATVTGYLISGIFFGVWDDWKFMLFLHGVATWISISYGPLFYRRWFTRDE